MSNCHVTELLDVYAAVLKDAACAFPALRGEFERDLIRLTRLGRTRGIHAFCKDLPAFGKHFDRCLSDGKFTVADIPLTKRKSATIQTPRFLGGLMQLIFDSGGSLRGDCNTEAVYFVRQICYLAKKVQVPCRPSEVLETIESFLETDSTVISHELTTSWWLARCEDSAMFEGRTQREAFVASLPPGFSWGPLEQAGVRSSMLLYWLSRTAGQVTSILGPYNPKEWRFKHGPGAVSEKSGKLNKYKFSNWSELLESLYPIADYGFHSWSAWASRIDEDETAVTNHNPSSRLVAVPKTFGKPRLIAAEPSEHQWCQQNCWNYMRQGIERSILNSFIGFTSQERNQRMALTGSETGQYTTLDLSDASDRLSLPLVTAVFWGNPGLLRHLRAVRTQSVRIDMTPFGKSEVKVHVLKKFSTMGSALTFPVETLCFFVLVYSTCMAFLNRNKPRGGATKDIWSEGSVSVFGDDIIVPTECWEPVRLVLEAFGLKVNVSKSFAEGNFRESCGVDAFRGQDVTPVYLRLLRGTSPEYHATTLAVRNNFQKKFLLNTAEAVAATSRWVFPPVSPYSGIAGWLTYSKPDYSAFKQRWNQDLQRWEIRMPVLTNRALRTPICDDSALLQFFTEDPEPYQEWSAGVDQRSKLQWAWKWVPVRELAYSEPPHPVIGMGSR